MMPYELVQLLILSVVAAVAADKMEVKFSWVHVDYTFASPDERKTAIDTKRFVPENCVILDADAFQCSGSTCGTSDSQPRVFVTVPRILPGNPATIAEVVPAGDGSDSHLLAPFPDWETNTIPDANLPIKCKETIISVFRTKIDDLGRFWVLDVGTIDQFAPTGHSVCPPKLMIYDLKNDNKIIKSYQFTSSYVKDMSLFTNVVVDIKDDDGQNTFAYISDTTAYKLVVYDFKNDDSWVVDQAYFYPYPTAARFNVNGVSFNFMDGVLGLALGPVTGSSRKLYFHSYASTRESWVDTGVLQKKSTFQNGLIDGADMFFVSEEARKFQSTVEVMTDDGILISTSMDNSLMCWNSKDPFTSDHLHQVYKDDENFQFPTGMKIIGDSVWAVSSQLQNLMSPDPVDPNSVKFRVLVGKVLDLVEK